MSAKSLPKLLISRDERGVTVTLLGDPPKSGRKVVSWQVFNSKDSGHGDRDFHAVVDLAHYASGRTADA